jgi:hypothetical protein
VVFDERVRRILRKSATRVTGWFGGVAFWGEIAAVSVGGRCRGGARFRVWGSGAGKLVAHGAACAGRLVAHGAACAGRLVAHGAACAHEVSLREAVVSQGWIWSYMGLQIRGGSADRFDKTK